MMSTFKKNLVNSPISSWFFCSLAVFLFQTTFLIAGVDETQSNATQKIIYQLPVGDEVFLVWGINGWGVLPENLQPEGTVIKDSIMFTPMQRAGGAFSVNVEVPLGSSIDFAFYITTLAGTQVELWDTNGEPGRDYHLDVKHNAIVEIQSKLKRINQEIRYHAREAGETYFVWGINDWNIVPEEMRPAGTFIHKGVMFSPMQLEDELFSVKIPIFPGIRIDYVFRITKTRHGETVLFSDLNTEQSTSSSQDLVSNPDSVSVATRDDYHFIAGAENVVEIWAPSSVLSQVAAVESGFSHLGLAVLVVLFFPILFIFWKLTQAVRRQQWWFQSGSDGAFSNNLIDFAGEKKKSIIINTSLVLLLLLITTAIAATFVTQEKIVHSWDNNAYQDETLARLLYFNDHPVNSFYGLGRAVKEIWESFGTSYSHLHVLPIIPLIHIFGNSRLVYILCLTYVYLLPLVVCIGFIAARMIPSYRRTAFWSAVFITLLTLPVWIATLNGFPDAGSAALICGAVLLYLRNPALDRWGPMVFIALCIVFAMLFRRHFIYSGLAFFIAITLQALVTFIIAKKNHQPHALRKLWQRSWRIGLTGLCALAILSTIGWPFLKLILSTNYIELYSSYEAPVPLVIRHFHDYYGWISSILALLGLVIGLRTGIVSRRVASLIIFTTGSAFLLWLVLSKQLGYHYTLHFNLAIIAGLVALALTTVHLFQGKKRNLLLGLTTTFLVFNLFVGISPADFLAAHPLTASEGFRTLFADRYPPLQRNDLDDLEELVNYLQETAPPEAPIYVAASSEFFNDDLLWHIQRNLFEDLATYSYNDFWQSRKLNILHWAPFYDSGGTYPLEWLMMAQYVIVTNPYQFHMPPEEQDVVKVVVDAFYQNWEFARDFELLPKRFVLADTVDVAIYQRMRPTSLETVLHTFKKMEKLIGERPGGQASWMNISAFPKTQWTFVSEKSGDSCSISINFKTSELSMLYLDELPDQVVISGQLAHYNDDLISELSLRIDAVDRDGKLVASGELLKDAGDDARLHCSLNTENADYLILNVTAEYESRFGDECWVIINNFKVTSL